MRDHELALLDVAELHVALLATSITHPLGHLPRGVQVLATVETRGAAALPRLAVDHSPSYLWNSATWENSEALLPFMQTVLSGPEAWDANETISRAIEIRDGVIQNPAITAFQGR